MNTLKFSNGASMPALGLGTWKSKPGEVYEAVKSAIEVGYRHIDCAAIYGNEKEIGQALTECFTNGMVKREELWITSKLWNTSHARDKVIPALQKTLGDLQLDFLDLYLIHWPVAMPEGVGFPQKPEDLISLDEMPISETWEGMEEAKEKGLAKHIGVSNFGIKHLSDLLAIAKEKPEMNQVERHPYFQQKDLLNFCKEHGIHMTGYSPLGSSDRPEGIKAKDEPSLLNNPLIGEIARNLNASPAQVLIAWALKCGTAVIPKSVHPDRIAQNFAADELKLSRDEMDKISTLEHGYRYISGSFWVIENGPYTLEGLWA